MEGTLFVDPFSPEYYGDRLFDAESPLNRDDCLAPLRQLRAEMERRKIAVKTADALWRGDGSRTERSYYLSLGMTQYLHRVAMTPSLVPLGTRPDPSAATRYGSSPRRVRATLSWQVGDW